MSYTTMFPTPPASRWRGERRDDLTYEVDDYVYMRHYTGFVGIYRCIGAEARNNEYELMYGHATYIWHLQGYTTPEQVGEIHSDSEFRSEVLEGRLIDVQTAIKLADASSTSVTEPQTSQPIPQSIPITPDIFQA